MFLWFTIDLYVVWLARSQNISALGRVWESCSISLSSSGLVHRLNGIENIVLCRTAAFAGNNGGTVLSFVTSVLAIITLNVTVCNALLKNNVV